MQTLNISVLQSGLVWEDPDANLAYFEDQISNLRDCNLVVLPEMCSTGFSMRPEMFAAEAGRKTTEWMLSVSNRIGSAVCGSTMMEREGKYYNTFVFAQEDGKVHFYDKRHLFSPGDESKHYQSGVDKVIIDYKSWKICPQVCYDLRFPVFSRNTENYDLLLYVANWPEKRNYAWQTLLKARAIENQCYLVACNRVGKDGNGIEHAGNSCVVNYLGEELSFGTQEGLYSFVLNKQGLNTYREQFPVLIDRDDFQLL